MGLFDAIGGLFGTENSYQAKAPVNGFKAEGANLDETQFSDAIAKARDAALAGTAGSGAAGDQAAFAQALKAQMAGAGPSLAQRQLETATAANNANAAGAVAGAKGINPALALRMIEQNRAATNQAAAGSSATLRMQEQLGTEGLLGSALSAQRGQDIGQQQANTALTGTLASANQGQNQARIANNQGTNQINASVGEGNANRELGAQQINAGVSAQNANTNAGILGGLMQGGGAALAAADGGEIPTAAEFAAALKVHRYSLGGDVTIPQLGIPDYSHTLTEGGDAFRGAGAGVAKAMGGKGKGGGEATTNANGSPLESFSPQGSPTAAPWEGAPSLLTSGVPFAAHGGSIDFRTGGPVPGRANVPGDSPANDTVPAVVSPGEVVLPRSVTQAPDAEQKAAEFVAAIKAKKKTASPSGYGKVLAGQRALAERLSRLEKFAEGGEVEEKPAPKKDDEHAPGWDIAEKISAALPDWLSGRSAVEAQRRRLAKMDAQTAEGR